MSTAAALTTADPDGPEAAASVAPCLRCGDRGGYVPPGQRRPKRLSAEPFGLKGKLCPPCAAALRRVVTGTVDPAAPVRPCARCKGHGKSAAPLDPAVRATRFRGAVFGIKGLICVDCQRTLVQEQPDAVARARAERDREQRERAAAGAYSLRKTLCRAQGQATEGVPPCDLCGRPDGAPEPGSGSEAPARYDARALAADLDGVVCLECRTDLLAERDRLKVVRLVEGAGKSLRDQSDRPRWEGMFDLVDAGPFGIDDVRGPLFTLALLRTYGPALRRAMRPVAIPRSEWSAP